MKSEKLRVPKLRFKEFSKDFEDKNFGDIYTFLQTNSFSRALLNYDSGEVKNIHYGDIHTKFKSNFYIQNEKVPFINSDIDITNIKDENYCQEKDLVIADASEDYKDIGKAIEIISLNNEKLLAGLHTYIARDIDDDMALGFSGYLMQTYSIRLQMMKAATGISVLGVSKGNLLKLKLNLPQKQEQEKIASFLSSIDKKIEQLSKKDELLESYKKGVMQKIFSQEIRFKDDDGNDYSDWEEKKLGDISTITTGSSNREDSSLDGEYTFFDRSEDIRTSNMFLFDGEAVIVAGEGQQFLPKYFIGKFDLHQRTYAIMNFDNTNGKFIYYYIFLNQNYFLSQAVGSTVKSLRLPMFQKMNIKLPSLEEQTKIANFLSSIDTKISQNRKALEETKKFKKALLQQMFM